MALLFHDLMFSPPGDVAYYICAVTFDEILLKEEMEFHQEVMPTKWFLLSCTFSLGYYSINY